MSRKFLLCDDDALMRRSLTFQLEQAGYHVHTAVKAEDALEFVHINLPDLAILDVGLPGMDGLDALREIKSRHNLPVAANWTKFLGWSWVWWKIARRPFIMDWVFPRR